MNKHIIQTKDGFMWEVLNFSTAANTFMGGKEVYRVYDDGSDALCVEADFEEPYGEEKSFNYAIEYEKHI